MEKYIQRENVALYKGCLGEPHTDADRKVLLKLLADEKAKDAPATQAGAALLPLPLVIAVASPAAGALAAKVGPRWLLITGPIIVAAGFLLALRIGSAASYWLEVFPAMFVIALGMACAVAPLTTAVLMSVDSDHTGAASGLNSAVARTGGLVATALTDLS